MKKLFWLAVMVIALAASARGQGGTGGGGGGGGGGSGTVTSVVIAGTSNQISAGGTCSITTTGTCTLTLTNAVFLGTDNSAAGTLQLSNGSANAHTTFGSAATTSNTILGPATVPTNNDLIYCAVVSTVCTLADSGVTYTSVIVNPMTTLGDTIYGGASGAPTRLAGPTATNGVAQTLITTPSGGAAVAPTWAPAGVVPNAQTGTSYTIAATDRAGYVSFSNASAIAVTLPQAGSSGFASNFVFATCDIGAGTATITPTTSTISYSTGTSYTSGASTLALSTGQCARVYSNNTNYFATVASGSASPALSSVTGSAAQATATETGTGHEWTYAGVETANLTYPLVFNDTGSGTNTSGVLGLQTITGTAMVPLIISETSASGDFADFWSGAAGFTNGVFSSTGGTKEFSFGSNGALNAALSVSVGTAPATTCGTGGCVSFTEGTIATGLSATDTFSPDSTHHCWDNNANNVDLGCTPGVTSGGLTSTAFVTAGANSFNLQTASATSTLSSGGNASFAGTVLATGTFGASATNTALTVQAGIDGTTQGSTAALTARGEDVTGGSTTTLTGGAITLRGGNNASTGNTSVGGALTANGGDATGGTGTSDAGGAVTIRGGNCTSTTGSCTPGSLTEQGGGFTAAFTNGQGADHIVASGLGTGNAIASHTKIQGPTFSQTSGTTAQTQSTQFITLKKAGSTTSATPTNIFSVAATGVPAAGAMVVVHVYTTQAAPHACSNTGIWEFAVQNDTTVSTNINRVDATVTTICDTGTMTMTAALSAANPAVFSVTPTWATIVPTAVWIEVSIVNPSDVDITPISD